MVNNSEVIEQKLKMFTMPTTRTPTTGKYNYNILGEF